MNAHLPYKIFQSLQDTTGNIIESNNEEQAKKTLFFIIK